jgi:phosphoribosylaminoimidazole-succinocarboxamide synthase
MIEYKFPNQINFYQGKVRDVYTLNNQLLVMVASNRISAFDVILPKLIPFKGQVLNQIAAFMLNATKDICPNWFISSPAPNVSIGKMCNPFKIELVVRGNLCGHAWRTYNSGKRSLCGIPLPDGLKENAFFNKPIITPTTKAIIGHDEDISKEDIIEQNLATEEEWSILEDYALKLFERGNELAAKQGLILADTKYEFGKINNEIFLMDEIHTPDSSRYFYADGFNERLEKNESQKQLSKEFVREWLLANNFMGKEGQAIPLMNEERVQTISLRYIELYEKIIGEKFIPIHFSNDETYKMVTEALSKI